MCETWWLQAYGGLLSFTGSSQCDPENDEGCDTMMQSAIPSERKLLPVADDEFARDMGDGECFYVAKNRDVTAALRRTWLEGCG